MGENSQLRTPLPAVPPDLLLHDIPRVRSELIATYRHVDKFIANVISPFRCNLDITSREMILKYRMIIDV